MSQDDFNPSEDFGSLDDLFGGLNDAKQQESERKAPFKFLDPYSAEDRSIYFGRDLEIAELYAKVYKSRLVVVYGESGSGKSSLLQCGLRGEIADEDALFIQMRSAIDPFKALRQELQREVAFQDMPDDITAALQQAVQIEDKTIVLFLDQFEEFFLFQPQAVRDKFIGHMADWLARDLDIRIIIGIREEFLARLTEMEQALPQLYDNRLWVRRMGRAQAEEVITAPCKACDVQIEPALVEELLDELTHGGKGIELPILQVVLDTLYRRAIEKDADALIISHAAYLELGKAHSILGRFVEERVAAFDDPEPVRQILKAMVTAEGTRRISSRAEILERSSQFGSALDEETLASLLNRLIDERILREDADNHLFELRHDALAHTVFQWMTGIEQELMEVRQSIENRFKDFQQRGLLLEKDMLEYLAPYETRLQLKGELAAFVSKSRKEAEKKRKRLLMMVSAITVIVLIVVSGLGILSYANYLDAEEKTKIAQEQTALAQAQRDFFRSGLRTFFSFLIEKKHKDAYIDWLSTSNRIDIFDSVLNGLIQSTESMDKDEKEYWFDILPGITKRQKARLLDILATEDTKLFDLDLKYQKEIRYLNEKHFKEWVESVKKEAEIKGDEEPELWYKLGKIYLDSSVEHKNQKAEAAFLKATQLIPSHQDAWYSLGVVYFNEKKYQLAKDAYLKQIDVYPKHQQVWFRLGQLYHYIYKNDPAAMKAYKKQTEINSEHERVWADMGSLIQSHGVIDGFKDAAFYYAKHLELYPKSRFVLANDVELALVQNDIPRFNKRYDALLPLLERNHGTYAIIHFYYWLSNTRSDWQKIIAKIKRLDKGIKFSWNFATSQIIFNRLNIKDKKIAELFVQFFENEINLTELEEKLKNIF